MWQCPKCKREFNNTNQDHYCVKITVIDDYIAEQEESIQPVLEQVRQCIRHAAPNAREIISWQMPTFWQGENIVHFAAFKKHFGLYPGDLSLAPFMDRLAGYHTSKGAIQFPYDKPVDFDLIADITKWRVQKVETSGKPAVIDFKKIEKALYQPKTTPSFIDVPEMLFMAIDGKGDPNASEEYTAAVALLYGLSYTIKMSNKAILEYVIPPLEGYWSLGDDFVGGGAVIPDKNKFVWTMLIRQPDFVTEDVFENARTILAEKKPGFDTSKVRLETIHEGLCVQVMHIGSYDDEPATIAALDKYAIENGCVLDINEFRRHHEIYLSDPRKTASEKLKTVLRHPVRGI